MKTPEEYEAELERDAMRASLETEIVKLSVRNESLTSTLGQLRAELERVPEDVESLRAERDRLNADLSDINIGCSARLRELEKAEADRDALRAEVDRLNQSIGERSDERAGLLAERDALRAEVAKVAKQRDDALAMTAEEFIRVGRVTIIEQERDALRAALGEAESGFREQREEIARQAAVITELEHKRATATAEIDRLDAVRRQQEQDNLDLIAACELSRKWLENCQPLVDIDGPKPLPVLDKVLTVKESEC